MDYTIRLAEEYDFHAQFFSLISHQAYRILNPAPPAAGTRVLNFNTSIYKEKKVSDPHINWAAIDAHPKFQALHRKKLFFLWGLMVFSIIYYFMLPIGAAYFQDIFKIKVWGVVNVGLLFALSEFMVAWLIAFFYSKKANAEFDAMSQGIINELNNGGMK
ncbi:MAG: DUF485 domain-containing protein [Gallionella sp.]